METKPAYKTTEFYITIVAVIVGIIAASGVIPTSGDKSIYVQIFGMVQTSLVSMGYGIARGIAKSGVKPD